MFLKFKSQFRISQGVIYALDYNRIIMSAIDMGYKIDEIFLEKLGLFESTLIEIINSGGDSVCTDQDKEKCKIQYGDHFEWACKRCEKNPKNRVKKKNG